MLLLILGLIQLVTFLLFQKWSKPIPAWYLAPLVMLCCGAIAAVMTNLFRMRTNILISIIISLILIFLSGFYEHKHVFKSSNSRNSDLMMDFVNAQPEGAIWASTDCGYIAFKSGVRFVNLDGVINGFEYQKALRDQKFKDYLKEAKVHYLYVGIWQHEQNNFFEPMYAHRADAAAFDGNYETFDYYVYSYMYGKYSDVLTLHREQEVYRSEPFLDGNTLSISVIFDLTKTDANNE